MSANYSVCYVPTATKIYRIHGNQTSDTIKPLGRFLDYLEVTWLCVNFWLREAERYTLQNESPGYVRSAPL